MASLSSKRVVAAGLFSLLAAAACGGPSAGGPGAKRGPGNTMDLKCNAKEHDRPFIIEWDATDMSSFEARASTDVVFVKYEGCTLKVLDGCSDDSIRGSLGAYKAVEWTSGSLEKLDIEDETELVAKLPLGVASLGGRVSSGEKFHMEYYVAGQRSATRPAVYKAELEKIAACKGATHFVYAYNLGAFGLGSKKTSKSEGGASVYGFGASASKSKSESAEKKGGDLATCKGDSAKEIEGCKVPIRLTLREISEGENPDKKAMSAPDTPESLSAVGKLDAKIKIQGEAGDRYKAATQKLASKDGKGCLAELDKHDKLNAKAMSTDPKSGIGHVRAQCLMLAGQCDAGKQLARKSFDAMGTFPGPEHIDRTVDAYAGMHCQGASMSQRDQMLKALTDLNTGAYMTKKDLKFCQTAIDTAKRLMPVVKPKDDEDMQLKDLDKRLYHQAAACLGKAGECDAARKAFTDLYPKEILDKMPDPKMRETIIKTQFDTMVQSCKGK